MSFNCTIKILIICRLFGFKNLFTKIDPPPLEPVLALMNGLLWECFQAIKSSVCNMV